MSKPLKETIWLTLEETERWGVPREDGTKSVTKFRVSGLRKSKPEGVSAAVVVRLNVTIDPAIFDAVVPVVDLNLQAGDVILPSIEVQPSGEVDGP